MLEYGGGVSEDAAVLYVCLQPIETTTRVDTRQQIYSFACV